MTEYNVLAAQVNVDVQADEYEIDREAMLLHFYKAGSRPGAARKLVATFRDWTYVDLLDGTEDGSRSV